MNLGSNNTISNTSKLPPQPKKRGRPPVKKPTSPPQTVIAADVDEIDEMTRSRPLVNDLISAAFATTIGSSDRVPQVAKAPSTPKEDCAKQTFKQLFKQPSQGGWFVGSACSRLTFTWTNNQNGTRNWSKLDRAMGNAAWFLQKHMIETIFLPAGLSDHSPIIVKLVAAMKKANKPFRYMNCWSLSNNFQGMVSRTWQKTVYGTKMYCIMAKLKILRQELKILNKHEFSSLLERIQNAKNDMEKSQVDSHNAPSDTGLQNLANWYKAKYRKMKQVEKISLTQRAKIRDIKFDDAGTKYFYAKIAERRHCNAIGSIQDMSGAECKGQTEVAEAFLAYYQQLLGSTVSTKEPIRPPGPTLTSEHKSFLETPFTNKDIKDALYSIDKNKSPGIDGFTSGFFCDTWHILGDDLCDAVRNFFISGQLLNQVNSTLITLISKTATPASVTDFRPISCCTTIYKIISKLLAQRLNQVLPHIIGIEQAAFVQGRDLFDNSALAFELARKYGQKNISPRCLIKVDIKKAFDSVNWEFLKFLLPYFGFPPLFSSWIVQCVTTTHFSLLINGNVEGYFAGRRGLRQGDPISPHLFVMCMEFLSRMLRGLATFKGFSYHPKCSQVKLTHLIFADDLLVFARGDLPSVKGVEQILHDFAQFSGLQANPLKTNIYFGGVHPEVKELILKEVGFTEGTFPFRYLGLPLHSARLSRAMFESLIGQIQQKLNHWANSLLSYAGKIQLINSVIFGIQNFWGASVLLPKGIAKKIEQACRSFLWGYSSDSRRMVFTRWKTICRPHQEGGVGIKEVLSWNKATLVKWIWKLVYRNDGVWAKWINCYILKRSCIWTIQAQDGGSWAWKNLLRIRNELIDKTGSWENARDLLSTKAKNGKLQIKHLYDLFRGTEPKVYWHQSLWDAACVPKHSFVSFMAIHNGLATIDNLSKRGMVMVNRCELCKDETETVKHLFFKCRFSKHLWGLVLH